MALYLLHKKQKTKSGGVPLMNVHSAAKVGNISCIQHQVLSLLKCQKMLPKLKI